MHPSCFYISNVQLWVLHGQKSDVQGLVTQNMMASHTILTINDIPCVLDHEDPKKLEF